MDRFLAEFGGGSFKDLLAKADDAAAPRPSAGPSLMPPASKARPGSAARPEPSSASGSKARPMAEPSSAPPAKIARHAAEPSAMAPTSKAQPAAPVAKHAEAVPSAAEVQVSTAEAAELAQVKAKALRLYRAAQDSCIQAAKADGERLGDPKVSEIACNVAEAQFASEFDIRWQDRGPRGSDAPSSWKGQKWREGSGRYANRGGNPEKNKWYAEQAKLKAKGKGKSKDKATDKGQDKGKNKGTDKGQTKGKNKGQDKGKDKGTNKGKDKDTDTGSTGI